MSTLEFSKEYKRANIYNNLKYKHKNMKKQFLAAAMEESKRRIPADATALMPFPIYCHQDKGLKRQNFSVFGKKNSMPRMGPEKDRHGGILVPCNVFASEKGRHGGLPLRGHPNQKKIFILIRAQPKHRPACRFDPGRGRQLSD
jgi:hypothetical protein